MGFSQFPAAVAGGGASVAAFVADLAAKNVTNVQTQAFEPGSYTITCSPTSTDISATFVDATTVITTQVTVTGTVSFTLASPATKVLITARNAATVFPTIVTIEKVGNVLTSTDIGNGTLDTINATGTYNETGLLAVLAISGGSFGPVGLVGDTPGSGGGAPGNIATGIVFANTATTVTVGAKGVARNTPAGSDTPATNSSFGNLIVAGNSTAFLSRGNGGGGGSANSGSAGAGNANQTFVSFNTTSTSGGGGGANGNLASAGGAGGGSGIGTGGAGGTNGSGDSINRVANAPGQNATGKGAGGGAGPTVGNTQANNSNNRVGGDGSDGVVYVLRGF